MNTSISIEQLKCFVAVSKKLNFKIANGFAITTNVYQEFIESNNIEQIVEETTITLIITIGLVTLVGIVASPFAFATVMLFSSWQIASKLTFMEAFEALNALHILGLRNVILIRQKQAFSDRHII